MKSRKIVFIDPESTKKKIFLVNEYGEKTMSVNSPCFCGSGKKQKKCHPDIHENSLIANLMRCWHNIEEETKMVTTLCHKGCNKCCEANFEISQAEFFLLLNALQITNDVMYYKRKSEFLLGPKELQKTNRCIFVDDYSGACKVYDVRPLICRSYGNYKNGCCKTIAENKTIFDGLLERSNYNMVANNIYFNGSQEETVMAIPKPLIVWFSNLNENGELKTRKQNDLYRAAFTAPIREYLRILQL